VGSAREGREKSRYEEEVEQAEFGAKESECT
jgi:hypothetical protein